MKSPALLLLFVCTHLFAMQGSGARSWVGSWATAPETPSERAHLLERASLREIVHLSLGGDAVRVRISNQFGETSLALAAGHIAVAGAGSAIVAGSDHPLTFAGKAGVAIPAGAVWYSDPVDLKVADNADLAISMYFEQPALVMTRHSMALQTNYEAPGDHTSDSQFPPTAETRTTYAFVTGVDVQPSRAQGAVVCLGDSITDGAASQPNTNHRWPNLLAERLLAANKRYGVLNEGISANRVLHDVYGPNARYSSGPNAIERFDSDVLAQSGVTHLIVLEGINDLGHPGSGEPMAEAVSAEQLEAAYEQLALRAHAHGIKVYVATILPFEGTPYPGYYSSEKEAERQAINGWLRGSKSFDAVIDLDRAMRDPGHPARMLPQYDSGDHLHPNDAGMKAMADAIPIELF